MTQTRIIVSHDRFASATNIRGWPNAMKTARWSLLPEKYVITISGTALRR